jgi:hypothetical protein
MNRYFDVGVSGNHDFDRYPARHCASRLRPRSGSGSSLAEARSSHCWRRTKATRTASERSASKAGRGIRAKRAEAVASAHTAGSRASAKSAEAVASVCMAGATSVHTSPSLSPWIDNGSWSANNPTDMTKGRIVADSVCILKWSLGGRF